MPLDGLNDSDQVVPAIAAALGFIFYEQQAQQSQLLAYLAGKQALLILDNAEQILDPALADKVLTTAPNVKMLVTTRDVEATAGMAPSRRRYGHGGVKRMIGATIKKSLTTRSYCSSNALNGCDLIST